MNKEGYGVFNFNGETGDLNRGLLRAKSHHCLFDRKMVIQERFLPLNVVLLHTPVIFLQPAPPTLAITSPGKHSESVLVGKSRRTYDLYVPTALKKGGPLPVIVFLHGVTGNAASIASSLEISKVAEREGILAVVPNGSGNLSGWNAGWIDLTGQGSDDVAFIGKLLDVTEANFRVDPRRIFIVGHSNGAFLANLVAARLSNRIAAIASVAGTIGGNVNDKVRTIPDPISPVSILLIHGKLDPIVSYDGTVRAMLVGVSAPNSARWWGEKIGAGRTTESVLFDGKATLRRYLGGRNGTEVALLTIANGTHDFPGSLQRGGVRESASGVDGMAEILKFFRDHPKK
ncbi:MAG: hypothetical protein C4320_06980 [Armatimonadota bacterium]